MPNFPRQDQHLQRTVERYLDVSFEVDGVVTTELVAQRMLEQSEVDKTILQERMSRIEAIKVHTFSSQEGVEVVKSVPQERISGRMCEKREVIDVTKIYSRCPSLFRILEQMIDVTKISDLDQGWQRTVEQLLDDTRRAFVN